MKLVRRETILRPGVGLTTRRLGAIREVYQGRYGEKPVEKYVLPDILVVAAFTPTGKMIVIREKRIGLGTQDQLIGETFERGEGSRPRQAAIRGLFEETGYRPKKIWLLTRLLESVGRSNTTIYCYIATGCYPGRGWEKEKNIKLIKLVDPFEFRRWIRAYLRIHRRRPHRNLQSLACLELALEELKLIRV